MPPATLSLSGFSQTDPTPLNPVRRRLEAIDILRGLLMILMALDHTRDFFYSHASVDPTDPLTSWPSLFVTRWITHLCAPGFVALAGASVYLQRVRGKSRPDLMRFLLSRGLWLIFLELTVIGFGWTFDEPTIFLQVIWAIGFSMIVLGVLQWLPTAAVGAIGATILLFHNLLDPIQAASFGKAAFLWILLHQGAPILWHGRVIGLAFYPVLSWVGIICVGYAFGPIANSSASAAQRHRITAGLAFLLLAAFSVLRLMGRYGDSFRFEHLGTLARSSMSFFEVQKYPPSLDYALATFGVLLLLYTAFDVLVSCNWLPRARGVIDAYGRVPFFYYVQHIYLIHILALVSTMALGGNWRFFLSTTDFFRFSGALPIGHSLPVVYAIWLMVVASLYPGCLWFSRLKARRRDWWLSYL